MFAEHHLWNLIMKVKVHEAGREGKRSEIDLCDKVMGISCFSRGSQKCVQGAVNLGKWTKGGYGREGGESRRRKTEGKGAGVPRGPEPLPVNCSLAPLPQPSLPRQAAINLVLRPACGCDAQVWERGAAPLPKRTPGLEGGKPRCPRRGWTRSVERR